MGAGFQSLNSSMPHCCSCKPEEVVVAQALNPVETAAAALPPYDPVAEEQLVANAAVVEQRMDQLQQSTTIIQLIQHRDSES